MSLAQRLKETRLARGLSQGKLASAVGITKATISQLEDGSIKRTSHVVKLAEILIVSPNWLEFGEGSMESSHIQLSKSERELISGFRQLNEADKECLLKVLAGINALTYAE